MALEPDQCEPENTQLDRVADVVQGWLDGSARGGSPTTPGRDRLKRERQSSSTAESTRTAPPHEPATT